MRFVIAAILLAAAPAAAAQAMLPTLDLGELRLQQENAQRRAIDQSNQLMALDTRLRAERAEAELQRLPPRAPELRYEPREPMTRGGAAAYPSVSDAVLADSNRRVQAAANNRR